jgi:lysozyme
MLAVTGSLVGLGACDSDVANSPYPAPRDYAVQGIDVSKYQGDVDWSAVSASGVRFAWIKATEGGDYLDEKFRQNWELSRAAGLRRGAYHFAYWCRPAQEQAAWFLSNVPNDPDALPPVLDVEWNPQSRTCPGKVSRDVAIADMKIMLDAMEKAYGKRPVIYTAVDFYRDVIRGEFEDYPMWVRSVKAYPTVKYGDRRWHFWQHTATGSVPGVRGYVDRNCYYGSLEDWQNWLQSEGLSNRA